MTDIPKFYQFMRPLLHVLQEHGEMSCNDAIEAVVKEMGLTEDQMCINQESNGKSLVGGRIGWASSYLRVAGALIGPKRDYFALGQNAIKLLVLNRPIKRTDLINFEEWKIHQASKQSKNQLPQESDRDLNIDDSTPEDLIEAGVKLIKAVGIGFT